MPAQPVITEEEGTCRTPAFGFRARSFDSTGLPPSDGTIITLVLEGITRSV
jgi:hypothetical protein